MRRKEGKQEGDLLLLLLYLRFELEKKCRKGAQKTLGFSHPPFGNTFSFLKVEAEKV